MGQCASLTTRAQEEQSVRGSVDQPRPSVEQILTDTVKLSFSIRGVVERTSGSPDFASRFQNREPGVLHVRLLTPLGGNREIARAVVSSRDADGILSTELELTFGQVQVFNLSFYVSSDGEEYLLGECTGSNQLHLARLLCSSGQRCLLTLNKEGGPAAGACCEVHAEEVTAHRTTVDVTLRTAEPPIARRSQRQLIPTHLIILRPATDGLWQEVYRSEERADGKWPGFKLTAKELCGGDMEMQLRLQAWTAATAEGRFRRRSAEDVLLGEAQVAVTALQDAGRSGVLTLTPVNDRVDRSSLRLKVLNVTIRRRPSFLDYIMSSCELKWLVGVDFAATSRPVSDAASIHHSQAEAGPSPCQKALGAFGSILEAYDARRAFPAWGFGGRMGNAPMSSCFPLNGNGFQPEISNVQGVLEAYNNTLRVVSPEGPMQLAPIIRAASDQFDTYSFSNRQMYAVLLLLLGGCPTDPQATLEALREAAGKPLSVLVVGIGDADFGPLEELVTMHSKVAGQQFLQVPCRFAKWPSLDHNSADSVASQLLAQIPNDLLAYYRSRKELPRPA